MTRARGSRGLTLIELVVAMAIFALVAVMGLQALNGSLRMRDRLVGIDTGTADLGLALSMLRADLAALVPMLFHDPAGPGPASALALSGDGRLLGLSVAGLSGTTGEGPALGRVEWRLDPAAGQLLRRTWPALYPAPSLRPGEETLFLQGVRGWRVRSHWPGQGWIPGVATGFPREEGPATDTDAAPVPQRYSSTLPDAVELTLVTEAFGEIVLVESLK